MTVVLERDAEMMLRTYDTMMVASLHNPCSRGCNCRLAPTFHLSKLTLHGSGLVFHGTQLTSGDNGKNSGYEKPDESNASLKTFIDRNAMPLLRQGRGWLVMLMGLFFSYGAFYYFLIGRFTIARLFLLIFLFVVHLALAFISPSLFWPFVLSFPPSSDLSAHELGPAPSPQNSTDGVKLAWLSTGKSVRTIVQQILLRPPSFSQRDIQIPRVRLKGSLIT